MISTKLNAAELNLLINYHKDLESRILKRTEAKPTIESLQHNKRVSYLMERLYKLDYTPPIDKEPQLL